MKNEKKKNNNNIKKKINEMNKKAKEQKTIKDKQIIVKKDEKPKQKKSKINKIKLLKLILILVLAFMIIGLIAVSLFFRMIVKQAPDFNPQNLFTQESSILYDKNNNEIAKLGTEKREKITYDKLPQILIDAIIATEDSTFFEHNGFNAARFLKASVKQALGGGGGGASTITMQVSKNAYTSKESSGFEGIKRKFTDIYLSIFKIEKAYTKEEILEFYVNSYYMGAGAYGVEQASKTYFNKTVSELNLAEAAILAGMFQAPGTYDPTINPEKTEERREIVLKLMVRHGFITKEEADIANSIPVKSLIVESAKNDSEEIDPRYKDFVDTVIEDVKKDTGFNPYTTPMQIYTTMDPEKQEYMSNIMNGSNFEWENEKVQAGIAVVDTNTGALVSIGAGRNRAGNSTYNYATMIKRQIGSTAKPLYDYGPLIEYENKSTHTLFYDEPYTYSGGTSIGNWDNGYKGLITAREALRQSRNIPALKAFQMNKKENVISFVTSLGLSPELENNTLHEAHAIGAYNGESPVSMAGAYAAFANGGYYTEPYSYTKIIYRNTEEVLENKPTTKKVMSDSTAYMIADMLVSTSGWSTKATSVNGITYGTKTGTTNYSDEIMSKYKLPGNAVNDLWVAGISKDYAIGLWYGYDTISREYYNHGSGNTTLYKQVIKGMYTGADSFTRPSNVVSVAIEKNSPDLLPSEYTPDSMKITELFKAGTEPTEVSTRFKKLSNVTNAKGKVSNNQIVLNWDNISTPEALSEEYLNNLYAPICKNVGACTNEILSENRNMFGNVTYQIYIKNTDGSLKLLHQTTNNTSSETIPTNTKTATYIIKTTYSNAGWATSDGVEIKVDLSNITVQEDIKISITGGDTVTITLPNKYTEPVSPLTIKDRNKDVTKSAVTTSEITKDNVKVAGITTEGTYKIKYTIKYNNKSYTKEKTVIIKKN